MNLIAETKEHEARKRSKINLKISREGEKNLQSQAGGSHVAFGCRLNVSEIKDPDRWALVFSVLSWWEGKACPAQ